MFMEFIFISNESMDYAALGLSLSCAYLNVLNKPKSCVSGIIDINGFSADQIDEFINDMYVD